MKIITALIMIIMIIMKTSLMRMIIMINVHIPQITHAKKLNLQNNLLVLHPKMIWVTFRKLSIKCLALPFPIVISYIGIFDM